MGVGEPPSLKDLEEVAHASNPDEALASVGFDDVYSQRAEELREERGMLGTSFVENSTDVAQASSVDTDPALTEFDELDSSTFPPTSATKTDFLQDLKEPVGSHPTPHLPTQGNSPLSSHTFLSIQENSKNIPLTSEIPDHRTPIQSSSNATKPQESTPSESLSIPSKSSNSPEETPKSATSKPPTKDGSVHQVKWISFNGSKVPVITQNENGPCPMIAITNVLLLRGKLALPADHEVVSSDLIIAALSDELLSHSTVDWDEGTRLNYEENLSSALSIFPSLQTGLDINVRFTGVSDFEYTPALTVFDLFRIPLYHGWVADPQDRDLVEALRNQTYNQVVEMIIDYKSSSDPARVEKSLLAKEFLETAASQLTMHGLCELSEHLQENHLAVLFRNNHFNTIYKKAGRIYVLVTDVGFVSEPNFVWETLNNIDGDSQFVDGDFRVCTKPTSATAAIATAPASSATTITPSSATSPSTLSAPSTTTVAAIPTPPSQQNVLDHKLAVERADLELAKLLQAEENAAYLKQAPSGSPSHRRQNGGGGGGGGGSGSGGHGPAKSPSSWHEEAQEQSSLELARRLQAEENAAYYSQSPGSPRYRPRQSPSHCSQHRHRHQREESPSSWKCAIS
ncbi:protein FAM63A [Echinococcus multilocularis]|uniref:Ubiquitin carboxyl-terminal hydrolase n=1 Tax=Echinococcus multilocularis TaxID=6211 RepID=A0A068YG89_ECHMU|nr:protein FAM63A [Echinococcus multilocularis]